MLIDMHAHSSGISQCCQVPYDEVLRCTREKGMDGIFLTNHYQKSYIKDETALSFAERSVKEFEDARKCGEAMGMPVFWGIEVTMELYPPVHMLIYGVDTGFLLENAELFDYTQEKLYNTVKQAGGILVQAHPYRNGATVLDTRFLDGVEINSHPAYGKTYREELWAIAKENGLLITCGGDYHGDTYRPLCGIYLPEDLNDGVEVGKYLKNQKELHLETHEVDGKPEKLVYVR